MKQVYYYKLTGEEASTSYTNESQAKAYLVKKFGWNIFMIFKK